MNPKNQSTSASLNNIFPICRSLLSGDQWEKLSQTYTKVQNNSPTKQKWYGASLPELIAEQTPALKFPLFLSDMAIIEKTKYEVKHDTTEMPNNVDRLMLNPTLSGIEIDWKLSEYLELDGSDEMQPKNEKELIVVWRHPNSSKIHLMSPGPKELLVMKMAVLNKTNEEAAGFFGKPVIQIARMVREVAKTGLVIVPRSHLKRTGDSFPSEDNIPDNFLYSQGFTLQWHLTNECELHCKHCYDRTQPSPLNFEQAKQIVSDFSAFCRNKRILGQVVLTGGNPFLFDNFMNLYHLIANTELEIAILGNPVSKHRLERLVNIRKPMFFQVSLEGLQEHNDTIRGQGYFQRVMDFLPLLREARIYSVVMLTLTQANIDEVIPLTRYLQDHVDIFTFNRLTHTGEGKNLKSARPEQYKAFLEKYMIEAETNPIMKFKDNLFNILQDQADKPLHPGCTGHGCGAAFDFVAVLPNGETHACRKFPSPIGNIIKDGFEKIYSSDDAERYRQGCTACQNCSVRHACGGCLAVTAGQGLKPFQQVDPYCFMHN